jgi:hypothetical protein
MRYACSHKRIQLSSRDNGRGPGIGQLVHGQASVQAGLSRAQEKTPCSGLMPVQGALKGTHARGKPTAKLCRAATQRHRGACDADSRRARVRFGRGEGFCIIFVVRCVRFVLAYADRFRCRAEPRLDTCEGGEGKREAIRELRAPRR